MKKLFTMIVLAMVLVGFTVIGSEAGVKKIRPDQLKVKYSSDIYEQSPEKVRSLDSSDCRWTAVVKLPVGKRITKLKYYHRGYSGAQTYVELKRRKTGESYQSLAYVYWADQTGGIIPVEDTVIDYPVVKSGYTYFVEVTSLNSNSYIYDIKIVYQD